MTKIGQNRTNYTFYKNDRSYYFSKNDETSLTPITTEQEDIIINQNDTQFYEESKLDRIESLRNQILTK